MRKTRRISGTNQKIRIPGMVLLAICVMCLTLLVDTKVMASSVEPNVEVGEVEPPVISVEYYSIEEDEAPYILKDGGCFEAEPELYIADSNTAAVKARIEAGLRAWEKQIDLSEFYLGTMEENKDNISKAFALFRQIINENPDLFYVSSGIQGSYGSHYLVLIPTYENYTQEDMDRFYKVSNEILSRIPASYSDLDKLLYLHDYLVTHCEYDMTYSKYNAYNALVEGSSVCQGYAEAYRYLCSRVGLDVKVVSSENLNHAWNIVALNNRYYFVDTTWDDPANITDPAYCGHRNFMRSTQGMVETDHTSTDWIREDGVNVYSYGTDSTLYDNSDWKDKRGAILVGEEVIKVTGISLSPTSTKLITGKTTTLKATITPSNATDKSVSWSSSNKSVATVDSNGVVKAVGAGSATITVTAKDGSGIKSTCKVTVSDPEPEVIKVTGISLSPTSTKLITGKTTTLKATITPSNATDKSVSWSSSNKSVATVDSNGVVKAVGAGSATITVTAKDGSGIKSTCKVTVSDPEPEVIKVTGISLSPTSTKLITGKTTTLKATITPSNATDKSVTWSSSNKKVATVDSNGVVKAVGAGSATITVTAKDGSGIKSTCKVTVSDPEPEVIKVTGISLSPTSTKLITGKTTTLKATITPSNATDKSVSWSSSNKSVATVDSNGVVKAVGAGSATITVTAKDGSGIKSTCKVTVSDPEPEVIKVTRISLSPTSTKLITGKTTTLKATITPSNATDKSVSWSSSNKKVATVDSNGVVKAVGAGSATITVTAKDGSGIKSTCKVTVSDPEPKKDTESKSVTDEFDDIKPGEWWVEAIQYVYDRKIMVGTGSLFEPAKALPREQFVQVLYNLSGQPSVKNISNKFSDVKNDWYTNAVLWASANGITNGYRDGKFGVGDGITREQMTVMLYNYAKLKNFDLSAKKGMTDQFKDGKAIDSWAKEAMNWAVSQGIMSGKGSGKDKSKLALDPLGGATRAECAALIMKLLVKNGL